MTASEIEPVATLAKDASTGSAAAAPGATGSDNKDIKGSSSLTPSSSASPGDIDETALANVSSSLPLDPKQARKAARSDIFTVFASGAALISDGYQNGSMTMLNPLFAKRYGSSVYTSEVSTRVSNALLVGAVIGQISVGLVCDRIGRKAAILLTTVLLVVGAIFATGASAINGSTTALFWWLTVARGAVGVGVGGEYPASSVSASEAANEKFGKKQRSAIFIAVTNVVLSFGTPFAVSMFLLFLSATGYSDTNQAYDLKRLDITWRLCFGFGALLPCTVFYFRWKMLNSTLYRQGAIRKNVPYWLVIKFYWRKFIGTAGVWFLYDVVAFSNGAFSGAVIATVLKNPTLKETGEYQLLVSTIALPGAILGPLAIGKLGAKNQLIVGFVGYIIIGLIVGAAWDHLIRIPVLFVILYGLLTSFGNFGPGSVCGLISRESYATSVAGTLYGSSAAIAKSGAAIGTQIFLPIQRRFGQSGTFYFAAGIGVLGVLVAFFFVTDTTKSDLAEEDERWRQYLLKNGWNGLMGDGSAPEHLASDAKAFDAAIQTDSSEAASETHAQQQQPATTPAPIKADS